MTYHLTPVWRYRTLELPYEGLHLGNHRIRLTQRPRLGKGDRPMILEQIHDLALTLFTIMVKCEAVREPVLRQRCRHACQAHGLDETAALLITESLASYRSGSSPQRTPLETPLAKAQAILRLTMGGVDAVGPSTAPIGIRPAPYAIAAMIGWVLTAGDDVRLLSP